MCIYVILKVGKPLGLVDMVPTSVIDEQWQQQNPQRQANKPFEWLDKVFQVQSIFQGFPVYIPKQYRLL